MPNKISRFSFKDGAYKDYPNIDYTAVHFGMDGTIAAIGSDEARPVAAESLNLGRFGGSSDSAAPTPRSAMPSARKSARGTGGDQPAAEEAPKDGEPKPEGAEGGEAEADEEDENAPKGPQKIEKNQFNFSDRQAQTFNYGMKEHQSMTEPAPVGNLNASATQWSIFDAYLELFLASRANKSDGRKKTETDAKSAGGAAAAAIAAAAAAAMDPMERLMMQLVGDASFTGKVKNLERLVNQNSEETQYHAFKFYDDPADKEKEDGTGSLTPLFTFSCEAAKNRTVTALVWNPKYADLFAVGYGSYDALNPSTSGMITCFSLKNPSFPEYVFTTGAGVMCLDFHPQHPALLACGFFDGTVAVFDVRSKQNAPVYVSRDPKTRHSEPVWSVKFQPEDAAAGTPLNFVSVSSDGRVTNWFLSKSELLNEELMELKLVPLKATAATGSLDSTQSMEATAEVKPNVGGAEKASASAALVGGLAAGSCLDFSPSHHSSYVVGTEQGAVHRCSTAFTGNYLQTFDGHSMGVYSIAWNRFHPRVFLSCSADWTVKIWESNTPRAMMNFDLGTSVGDAAWAPYASTVFAACTSDGKVFVFDLATNKYDPIAQFQYAKPRKEAAAGAGGAGKDANASATVKCTRVCFNPRNPVILVGDDRGNITSFKLSPNLRYGLGVCLFALVRGVVFSLYSSTCHVLAMLQKNTREWLEGNQCGQRSRAFRKAAAACHQEQD